MRGFLSFSVLVMIAMAPTAKALVQSDFDTVAFKWNTGETVADGPFGIEASPAPVFDAAVNFQALDRAVDLVLTEGPLGSGSVVFGWMDSALWVPSNGDGIDLVADNPAHRVYATISNSGEVAIFSAVPFSAGIEVGRATVSLDPQAVWRLSVLLEIGLVQLWLDDQLLIEAPAFPAGGADPDQLGNDFAISVLSGLDDTGEATINDLARNPRLAVERYPRVLPHRELSPVLVGPRTTDILLPGEDADLGIFVKSIGSTSATNVTATLVAPSGLGLNVLSGPVAVPEIDPGASTLLIFTVQTSSVTPVGSHAFSLELSGGVSQTIEVAVPVWDVDVTITDLQGGIANGSFTTPFNQWTFDLVAPEVFENGTPSWFDIQVLNFEVTHASPFSGTFWEEAVLEQVIAARGDGSRATFLNGTVRTKDANNQPVILPGSTVALYPVPGNQPRIEIADAQGQFEFINVPPGVYRLVIFPPEPLRKNTGLLESQPFEVGTDSLTLNVTVPRPPPEADPRFIGPPAVAQGQTGTETRPPPPPPANPPPPGEPPDTTARSIGVGFVTGVVLDLIDLGLAPKSFGASLASILAGNAGGCLGGWLADPLDQDVFYVGRGLTPPLDSAERTLVERLEMNAQISTPQPLFDPPVVQSTSSTFDYTRQTDQRNYLASSSESLSFQVLLPTAASARIDATDPSRMIAKIEVNHANGQPLGWPDVLLQVWMLGADNHTLMVTDFPRDDGIGPDDIAGDGIFHVSLPFDCNVGGVVYFGGNRSGFFPAEWPSSMAVWRGDLQALGVCEVPIFKDSFELSIF